MYTELESSITRTVVLHVHCKEHLNPLQVEHSDSNSRLVVDEADNAIIQPSKG